MAAWAFVARGSGGAYANGVAAYREGRREAAAGEFDARGQGGEVAERVRQAWSSRRAKAVGPALPTAGTWRKPRSTSSRGTCPCSSRSSFCTAR